MSQNTRRAILFAVLVVIGAVLYIYAPRAKPLNTGDAVLPVITVADKEGKYPHAVEITNPSGFINTEPFKIADYLGKKVIMVDFWTYSCINCQRTTPYLVAWDKKYRDQGLVIVGVHTPEFDFEKIKSNVEKATKQAGIEYPVVQDNDFGTWQAYANRYWPHKYLIDIDGYIVYDHVGEGGYAETEAEIQKLLKERMTKLGEKGTVATGTVNPQADSIDDNNPRTPEIYFGASRNEFIGNGTIGKVGLQTFTLPSKLSLDRWYFGGNWFLENEFAELKSETGEIDLSYQAKNVYMVASSPKPVQVEIFIDDKKTGEITVQDDTLYTLAKMPAWGKHTLKLKIKGAGLKAFTFTFG